MITKRLQRLLDYRKDKRLADKCGLKVKDICVHEVDDRLESLKIVINSDDENFGKIVNLKCIKCGEFYR